MYDSKYRIVKVVLVVAMLLVLFFVLHYRFGHNDSEKVFGFHQDNLEAYNLLKDEILLRSDRTKLNIDNNGAIDSLQKQLYITHSWISSDANNMLTIHLETDFGNYLEPFEYQYCEDELVEAETNDGIAIRKIDQHWGVFRRWGLYWGLVLF